MGFPRIVSKNNKIYTKLGEICLSGDGHQFWIVCHTCQEELQTQDNFWKHIQDEHNFMHGYKQEGVRTVGSGYLETSDGNASLIPLPLFRKISATEQQRVEEVGVVSGETEEMQKETKDYTEMRTHEDQVSNASVSIDIKLEPSSLSQTHHHSHLHASQNQQQQQQQHQQQQQQQQQHHQHQQQAAATAAAHLDMGGSSLMYQMHPPVSAYAALVQAPTINTLNMSVAAAAAAAAQVPTSIAALLPQDLPKESIAIVANNTNNVRNLNSSNNNNNNNGSSNNHPHNNNNNNTNNNGNNHHVTNNNSTLMLMSGSGGGGGGGGGSTVSSDDGERWYICDYENCGLKFKYQSRLELHRSVHSKERRFACEICGASFKQSCNLSTHRKKKHALRGIKSSPILPGQRF